MIKPIRLSAAEKGLLLLDIDIGIGSGEEGGGEFMLEFNRISLRPLIHSE